MRPNIGQTKSKVTLTASQSSSEIDEMASNNSSNDWTIRKRTGNEQAPLPREKLPQDLQKIVDNEDSLLEQIYDGT